MTMQQGQHLAALTRYYTGFRTSFLEWAAERFQQPTDISLANYRRALIAWYEATIRPTDPYTGKTDAFVKAMVDYYFHPTTIEPSLTGAAMPVGDDLATGTFERPLHYIPRPIRLSGPQQQMLAGFQQMSGKCKELILMVEYHRIEYGRIAEVLDVPGGITDVKERLHKCRVLVHEGWQTYGITDPAQLPTPADDDLIEAYFSGELETTERWAVEARIPNDPFFRKAMELREDWSEVLTVAGRQDLMETLQREEAGIARGTSPQNSAPAAAPGISRVEGDDVKLSRRGTWLDGLTMPGWQSILAILLVAALAYLAYTTFGAGAPDRKAVANFEPFPNIFASAEPRTEDERDLQRILYYYDRGDYATAYDELLPVADAYPAAPLYLGVSALALEQPSRALEWFDRIPDGNYYRPYAEWYEALAYLSEARSEAGRATLSDIAETPDHPYRQRAERLLTEIR